MYGYEGYLSVASWAYYLVGVAMLVARRPARVGNTLGWSAIPVLGSLILYFTRAWGGLSPLHWIAWWSVGALTWTLWFVRGPAADTLGWPFVAASRLANGDRRARLQNLYGQFGACVSQNRPVVLVLCCVVFGVPLAVLAVGTAITWIASR